MSWTKITDEFLEDDTITDLSDRGYRLFVSGIVYCSRNLTDGVITAKGLNVLQAIVGYRVQKYAAELVAAGLWTESGGDHCVRNFLKFNRDAATVKEDRRKARDRMAKLRNGSAEHRANVRRITGEQFG